ncbi:hypothetical protein GT039_16330, partial [Streptomyces sp. SID2955]|nr:hypothetical protein [Streptomyces sp. SID2955]
MPSRASFRAAAAATVFAAFLVPATAQAAPSAAAAPGEAVTLPVREVLAQLPVRTEDRTGQERTKFRHWVDADRMPAPAPAPP